jgi:predicted NBD/HSP70 family sugar kinase
MYLLAIDIGGTTYSFSLFKDGHLFLNSDNYDITKYIDHELLFKDLYLVVREKIDIGLISKIGIACPGPLDSASGTILNTPNLKFLRNVNIKDELKKHFNIKDIHVEHDANVYTLGFYNRLTTKNKDDVVLGITLGTGIGFGIIINEKLFKGSYGMSGEYERSPVLNDKTWADLIGRDFFELITQLYFKKNVTPKELFELADNNNSKALNIWKNYGNNIGKCLCHVIGLLNPNYISIGGGVSKANKYFHNYIIKALEKHCLIYDKKKINISYDETNLNIFYGWV